MSIQNLDIVMPNSILVWGVTGTLSRKNDRSANPAGYVSVNAVRDITMRAYQLATAPMRLDDAEKLAGIYEVTDAGAFGFLLQDPIDSSFDASNGALQGYMSGVEFGTVGFGNGCPTYGIRKFYTAWGTSIKRARSITRPNGAIAVTRGGSPVTYGVTAGNIAISARPSYITFVPDATRTVSAVTVGSATQVTLNSAIGVVIGGRLWLQGLTGADAALLNNLSHEVTNVAGAVYTLATNTAGKTITAGSGQGHKYPQPDEALTAAGNFYVPVHFRDDNMDWDLVIAGPMSGRMVSIPQTFLDEVREA
jgi:hypothetical protein